MRISHWGIALAVVVNRLVSEPGETVHVWVGWAAMTLLAIRLAWGVIGPSEARFKAFPPAPWAAMRHLGGLLRGRAHEYPSHNPAGAMMIYALWLCLIVIVATGLIMTDGKSPTTIAEDRAAVAAGDWSVLVNDSSEADDAGKESGSDLVEEVHSVAANMLFILAIVHVLGVALESRALGRNLVRPMVGLKDRWR